MEGSTWPWRAPCGRHCGRRRRCGCDRRFGWRNRCSCGCRGRWLCGRGWDRYRRRCDPTTGCSQTHCARCNHLQSISSRQSTGCHFGSSLVVRFVGAFSGTAAFLCLLTTEAYGACCRVTTPFPQSGSLIVTHATACLSSNPSINPPARLGGRDSLGVAPDLRLRYGRPSS